MFDPYHKWLGIRKNQRPPTHYQLLGIAPDEQDPEVIEEAAIRQSTHVRAYQIGAHGQECTRILNEISQARTTLLNPAKRKDYDAQLAQKSAPAEQPLLATLEPPSSQIMETPPAPSVFSGMASEPEGLTGAARSASSAKEGAAVPSISKPGVFLTRPMLLGIVGGGAALLLIGGVLVVVLGLLFWQWGAAPPPVAGGKKLDKVVDKKDADKKLVVVPDGKGKPPDPVVDAPKGNDKDQKPVVRPGLPNAETEALLKELGSPKLVDAKRTPLVGGNVGQPYHDHFWGAVLVGFKLSEANVDGNTVIAMVQPIFLTWSGHENALQMRGTPGLEVKSSHAPPGYAVGSVTLQGGVGGVGVAGMSIKYMKIKGRGLDPNDFVESPWFGGTGVGPKMTVPGGGLLIVGIFGSATGPDEKAAPKVSLGLLYAAFKADLVLKGPLRDAGSPEANLLALTKAADAARLAFRISRTQMLGSGKDRYEVISDRLLCGFAVALAKFGDSPTIGTIRPLFLNTDSKLIELQAFGPDEKTDQRVVAPPGYAVGAVTVKAGAGIDGMSVTFMKIKANGLDPFDEPIESPWVGGMAGDKKVILGGSGAPIIGIFGKTADPDTPTFNGLGLVMAVLEADVAQKGPPPLPDKALLEANLLALTKAVADARREGRTSRSQMVGSGDDPYEDTTDRLLAGFVVGIGKSGDDANVTAIVPLFLNLDGKRVNGQIHGSGDSADKTIIGPPGYAVGAVTVKAGASIDGIKVTFMKIKANGLDPLDAPLATAWYGGMGGGPGVRLGGNGDPIIGIFGKTSKVSHGFGVVSAKVNANIAKVPEPKLPPGKELMQAADIAVSLEVRRNEFPHELLFSAPEHHRAAIWSSGQDDTANLAVFDLAGKQKVSTTAVIKTNFSPCLRSLSPTGKHFSQSTLEGRLNIWETGKAKPIVREWSLADGRLANVLFPEDDKVLTVTITGTIEVWQLPAMKRLIRVEGLPGQSITEHGGVALSLDRKRCAIFNAMNFRVHDTVKGKLVCPVTPLPPAKGNKGMRPRSVAFSPDGSRLVVALHSQDGGNAVHCFDAKTGKLRSSVTGPDVDDVRILFGRVGWWGPDHFFINGKDQKPLTVYRASDGVPVANVSPSGGAVYADYNGYDQRLWYCAPLPGEPFVSLLGVPLPEALRGNPPAQPISLSISPQGLLR